jgi:hypothetical protein
MGFYAKKKSEVPKVTDKILQLLKSQGCKIDYLRCDNASEHRTDLKVICMSFGVTMECTAPNTPQQNGVVERKFVTEIKDLL